MKNDIFNIYFFIIGIILGHLFNIYFFVEKECGHCGQSILIKRILIELSTGILFLITYNIYGLDIIIINYLVFIYLLLIITIIDTKYYIIPNNILLFGSIFTLLFNLINKEIYTKDSLIGAIVCGGGVFILSSLIEFISKKEVIGGGDIKLFFMVGLFLGIKLGLLTIFLSTYLGLFYAILITIHSKIKKLEYNLMIPYGPFVSLGAIISVLCGTNIINWYVNKLELFYLVNTQI